MSSGQLVEEGTMITYVQTNELTLRVILTNLAAYWSLTHTATNASEIALEQIKSAKARGKAQFKHVGMRAWRHRDAA
jgi:hypothetical protein